MRIEPEVVQAACKGDTAAIEQLLVRAQPDLRRFARRACATRQDAEDAVQVALWKIYRHIGALRSVAAFATWIFRLIERECIKAFAALRLTDSLDEEALLAAKAPDSHEALRLDLVTAIASLPPTYAQILVLRDVDEWTAAEVAAHLNITVEAAKSRLHRARALLRERLSVGKYGVADAP
jgi:RNA polymerase sigma factor (sigma-70 family)